MSLVDAKVRDRMIVALDYPNVSAAEALVWQLGDIVTFYKIGLELSIAGGLDLAADLIGAGKKVFLDLKLHDIGNTVERATAAAAERGVHILTVHAYPQTMAAAARGAKGSPLEVLGVTVLTSYDDTDLAIAGYRMGVTDTVRLRAGQGAGGGDCRGHLRAHRCSHGARHPRAGWPGGDARGAAQGGGRGRPEARRHPGAGHCRRRRPHRGGPAGDGRGGSGGGGGGHPRGTGGRLTPLPLKQGV